MVKKPIVSDEDRMKMEAVLEALGAPKELVTEGMPELIAAIAQAKGKMLDDAKSIVQEYKIPGVLAAYVIKATLQIIIKNFEKVEEEELGKGVLPNASEIIASLERIDKAKVRLVPKASDGGIPYDEILNRSQGEE